MGFSTNMKPYSEMLEVPASEAHRHDNALPVMLRSDGSRYTTAAAIEDYAMREILGNATVTVVHPRDVKALAIAVQNEINSARECLTANGIQIVEATP
jgi:hypothetical protein